MIITSSHGNVNMILKLPWELFIHLEQFGRNVKIENYDDGVLDLFLI